MHSTHARTYKRTDVYRNGIFIVYASARCHPIKSRPVNTKKLSSRARIETGINNMLCATCAPVCVCVCKWSIKRHCDRTEWPCVAHCSSHIDISIVVQFFMLFLLPADCRDRYTRPIRLQQRCKAAWPPFTVVAPHNSNSQFINLIIIIPYT